MPHCHEMHVGQVYMCPECGLELQVVKECRECATPEGECACEEPCIFECCGEELQLKQS